MGYFDLLKCPVCSTPVPFREWSKFKNEKLATCDTCRTTLWQVDTGGRIAKFFLGTLPGIAAGVFFTGFFILMDKSSPLQWLLYVTILMIAVVCFLIYAIAQVPLTNKYLPWYAVCKHCAHEFSHAEHEVCPKCSKPPACLQCGYDVRHFKDDRCPECGLQLTKES